MKKSHPWNEHVGKDVDANYFEIYMWVVLGSLQFEKENFKILKLTLKPWEVKVTGGMVVVKKKNSKKFLNMIINRKI